MSSPDNWEFVFILPNISIKNSVGNDNIAICSPNDPRVEDLIQLHSNIRYLVTGFTDQLNRKITPSVLIRKNRPHNQYIRDSLIDFRNIYAICCVINGWQNLLNRDDGQLMPSNVLYSDYFDIYPIVPNSKDDYLAIISPAARGLDTASEFTGQISPSIVSQVHNPHYDHALFKALSKEWMKRHILRRYSDWELISLFRSLQIAYQALSMADSNFSTIYDYGTNLSLWVSAFEILAHPKNGSVNLQSVLSLLDNSFLLKELIKRLYTVDFHKKSHRVNLVQKLYCQIYNARNCYIHGNPVKTKDVTPWGKINRHPLYAFAPLIFEVALISRTDINYYLDDDDRVFNQMKIERALLKSKSKKPKSIRPEIGI
ncbi:MAG: hypothetical protein WBH01_04320 [Dehalococcoidia bacterium]